MPVTPTAASLKRSPAAHLDFTDSQAYPTVTQVDARLPEVAIYATHDCTDDVARKIGVVIDTPSGLLLWMHDTDCDPDDGDWMPLLHGPVDDMDSARRHARANDLVLHPIVDGVAPVGA